MVSETVSLRMRLDGRSQVESGLGSLEGRLRSTSKIGSLAATGLSKAWLAGGVAIAGATKILHDSFDEARESQKVNAQTNAVLKSTGGIANVTAKQLGNLSNEISKKVGIDDEAIQSAGNVLLTFKGVRNEVGKGNDIFNQATQTITDMSVALGTDLQGSTIQVGKALNDPIKGITALQRVGVTFSDGQKTQIANLVEHNNLLGAQKIILGELTSEFGGSAAAQATSADKLSVAWGNVEEKLGLALLPLVDDVENALLHKGIPALSKFVGEFQRKGVPAIKDFADKVKPLAIELLPAIATGLGDVKDIVGKLAPPVGELVGAFNDLPGGMQKLLVGGALVGAVGLKARSTLGGLGLGGSSESAIGGLIGHAGVQRVWVVNAGAIGGGDGLGGGGGSTGAGSRANRKLTGGALASIPFLLAGMDDHDKSSTANRAIGLALLGGRLGGPWGAAAGAFVGSVATPQSLSADPTDNVVNGLGKYVGDPYQGQAPDYRGVQKTLGRGLRYTPATLKYASNALNESGAVYYGKQAGLGDKQLAMALRSLVAGPNATTSWINKFARSSQYQNESTLQRTQSTAFLTGLQNTQGLLTQARGAGLIFGAISPALKAYQTAQAHQDRNLLGGGPSNITGAGPSLMGIKASTSAAEQLGRVINALPKEVRAQVLTPGADQSRAALLKLADQADLTAKQRKLVVQMANSQALLNQLHTISSTADNTARPRTLTITEVGHLLVGGLFGSPSPSAPSSKPPTHRALGGPLGAGEVAIVGEHGPEVWVPDRAGWVIPNRDRGRGGAPAMAHAAVSEVPLEEHIHVHLDGREVAHVVHEVDRRKAARR